MLPILLLTAGNVLGGLASRIGIGLGRIFPIIFGRLTLFARWITRYVRRLIDTFYDTFKKDPLRAFEFFLIAYVTFSD